MRISTAQYYATTAANYSRNLNNVVKTAEQASSGIKVATAADDPVGAARLLQLEQQKAMLGSTLAISKRWVPPRRRKKACWTASTLCCKRSASWLYVLGVHR